MKQPSKPPDFIIIGVQKGGTTSLYNYLIQHPQIAAAAQKGTRHCRLLCVCRLLYVCRVPTYFG